jgi:hypothetical protein
MNRGIQAMGNSGDTILNCIREGAERAKGLNLYL